jgi:hypothetical protein
MTTVILFCLLILGCVGYVVRTAWQEHWYQDGHTAD